jgi:succinoglycan biosynthesis transport protein ExoP
MLQRNSEIVRLAPPEVASPGPFPVARGAFDLREIFRILQRRRRIVIGATVAALAGAILFVLWVTPLFTATSTVLIDPRRPAVADSNAQAPPSNFGTDDASIESQVLLIRSLAVLRRVVESLKLVDDPEFVPPPGMFGRLRMALTRLVSTKQPAADGAKADAIEALKRRINVVRQRNTFVVDVEASSRDAAKAATIANAVADSYFIEQVRSKYGATRIAADWLNGQIEQLRNRVLASDRAVEDFRAANNLIVSQGVTVNDQQITDLNNKLIEASADASEASAKYEQVQQLAKKNADPGSVAEALSSDTIARLRTQYAELAKTSAELSTKYGPRHPQVAAVRAQLQDTQRLIGDEVQRILVARRHSYEVAVARVDSLRKSLDGLQGVSTTSGQAQVRLRELQREADANRTIYESFLARYREASAQESLELPEARVVAQAAVPLYPSYPKTILTLALAPLLGFGLGSILALIADRLDRRIKTLEQAETVSGVDGLAAIPLVGVREVVRLAKRGREELGRFDPRTNRMFPPALQPPILRYAIDEPTSLFAEAVRGVRLAVQRAGRAGTSQVVLVTSALDGEGKTTLAANLAASFAVIGIRTALVEGDLRNPELTRSMCPHATVGVIDVALERAPLHQALLVDRSTGLSLLPSPPPRDAMLTELIFSSGMSVLFSDLRRHYQVIVVDSPPLMPLVDGRALAEHVDNIVLAVAWDRTPQDVVTHAVELLSPVRDRILGTVLTQVDLERMRYYDRYLGSSYKRYAYGYGFGQAAQEASR